MKKMNRREFLTLTGAAVVALSLAGCGGGSSAPAVPTGKEAELLAAINRVWKKKYEEKAVVHEQLTLNQDAVDAIRCYGRLAGAAGISEPSTEKVVALEDEYSCEDTAVRVFVDKLLNNSNSAKAEFISIYLPVVKNVTYMTAVVFRNNNP